MIKYHGLPFGGSKQEAAEALVGRHAFVSFADQSQLDIALEVCQSIALDNGAFSAWRSGKEVDWNEYFEWVKTLARNPRVDFAVIPDVIDGDEMDNERLIAMWHQAFHSDYKGLYFGCPVWHMHESKEKLNYLSRAYYRIAIGSSAEYAQVGSVVWHDRMNWAMSVLCEDGQPRCKIHMLRGLDAETFKPYPFASADSTNAGRNCALTNRWDGTYSPPSATWKARVIMARIESDNSAQRYEQRMSQEILI